MDQGSLEEQIRALLKGGEPHDATGCGSSSRRDRSCKLVVHYHGGRAEYMCTTVREALQRAISTLGGADAWPVRIEQEGRTLWEIQDGPDSRTTLETLLQAHP